MITARSCHHTSRSQVDLHLTCTSFEFPSPHNACTTCRFTAGPLRSPPLVPLLHSDCLRHPLTCSRTFTAVLHHCTAPLSGPEPHSAFAFTVDRGLQCHGFTVQSHHVPRFSLCRFLLLPHLDLPAPAIFSTDDFASPASALHYCSFTLGSALHLISPGYTWDGSATRGPLCASLAAVGSDCWFPRTVLRTLVAHASASIFSPLSYLPAHTRTPLHWMGSCAPILRTCLTHPMHWDRDRIALLLGLLLPAALRVHTALCATVSHLSHCTLCARSPLLLDASHVHSHVQMVTFSGLRTSVQFDFTTLFGKVTDAFSSPTSDTTSLPVGCTFSSRTASLSGIFTEHIPLWFLHLCTATVGRFPGVCCTHRFTRAPTHASHCTRHSHGILFFTCTILPHTVLPQVTLRLRSRRYGLVR